MRHCGLAEKEPEQRQHVRQCQPHAPMGAGGERERRVPRKSEYGNASLSVAGVVPSDAFHSRRSRRIGCQRRRSEGVFAPNRRGVPFLGVPLEFVRDRARGRRVAEVPAHGRHAATSLDIRDGCSDVRPER